MMRASSETAPYEDMDEDAYMEGAFYAETDWQWARMSLCGPRSLAQHCDLAWTASTEAVDPAWDNERMRLSFYIGYEDRATELADAGEAGYEALAEAGSLAATREWEVQSERWSVKASDAEKAMRAMLAAWRGAVAWRWRFDNTRELSVRYEVEIAEIRAAGVAHALLQLPS